MTYLIDDTIQREIAEHIDQAVAEVLSEIPNHGSEEGVTPVLGHALMRQSFRSKTVSVEFNYRQLNKQTEEPYAGADGGVLVRVTNADGATKKAALFQAKLLKGDGPVRQLTMRTQDAQRLKSQARDMLGHTEEAVAIFYTERQIYVVDAEHYRTSTVQDARTPLSPKQRLVTLV
ncbi:hypothetical protein [Sorangium sp. So ce406]|uniref:hypothetical protein n=1 Tax=Sorangium sp. So ce406 TaxID=3133311 RepID=UPI003F5BF28D